MDVDRSILEFEFSEDFLDDGREYERIFEKDIWLKELKDDLVQHLAPIYESRNTGERGEANDIVVNALSTNGLGEYRKKILRENLKDTIKMLHFHERDSTLPYVLHPIGGLEILLSMDAPFDACLSYTRHDNIEEFTKSIYELINSKEIVQDPKIFRDVLNNKDNKKEHKKYTTLDGRTKYQLITEFKKKGDLTKSEISSILFRGEYKRLKHVINMGTKRFLREKGEMYTPECVKDYYTEKLDRTLIYAIIGIYKLTRIEDIEDYEQSVKRISDRDLDKDSRLKWLFDSYRKEYGEELVLDNEEIDHIIYSTYMGKLADRIDITLDFHQPLSLKNRIKIHDKNKVIMNEAIYFLESTNISNEEKERLSKMVFHLAQIDEKRYNYQISVLQNHAGTHLTDDEYQFIKNEFKDVWK